MLAHSLVYLLSAVRACDVLPICWLQPQMPPCKLPLPLTAAATFQPSRLTTVSLPFSFPPTDSAT